MVACVGNDDSNVCPDLRQLSFGTSGGVHGLRRCWLRPNSELQHERRYDKSHADGRAAHWASDAPSPGDEQHDPARRKQHELRTQPAAHWDAQRDGARRHQYRHCAFLE